MKVTIENSWKKVLNDEFDKPYFNKLTNFIKTEKLKTDSYEKRFKNFSVSNDYSEP